LLRSVRGFPLLGWRSSLPPLERVIGLPVPAPDSRTSSGSGGTLREFPTIASSLIWHVEFMILRKGASSALIMPGSRVRVPSFPPILLTVRAAPPALTIESAGGLREPNSLTFSAHNRSKLRRNRIQTATSGAIHIPFRTSGYCSPSAAAHAGAGSSVRLLRPFATIYVTTKCASIELLLTTSWSLVPSVQESPAW
jgi:hypothetical protein